MAPLDFLFPILPSDQRIRQTLLYGPRSGQPSPLPIPQHRRLDIPLEQRDIIERNFTYQTTAPPARSWSLLKTEQYVHYKDRLMITYLYDYPAHAWVSCAEVARFAVEALLAREQMRAMGFSVFERDTKYSWWMSGEIDTEFKEEVEEDEKVKHEPIAPSNVSETKIPPTARESEAQMIREDAAGDQRAIEDDATINFSPRRSIRISQRKSRDASHQQVNIKEEPMDERTEHQAPQTPQVPEISTALKGSEGKKIVQIKQEDDDNSPRRSTRNAPKRKFADEPWSTATKKTKW